MLVPIKESTRPVLIVTKATPMRLGLSNVGASVKPYDDKKSITDYVDRVTAKGKMCEVLDAVCETEISKLCKELTDFHVTIF